LNSGSSANSTLIQAGGTSILLDAGLSGKETARRLDAISVPPDQINGLLVSHGHRDHTNGIGVLARRHKIPVYLNRKTSEEIGDTVGKIPEERHVKTGSSFKIGELYIETFSVSHDSLDPMGFIFHNGGVSVAYLTDLGRVTKTILNRIRNRDLIILESNHDLNMLINGPYPEMLKRRILGPEGHLSNIASANALVDAVGPNTDQVVLAHLSENNNQPELVLSTVQEIFEEEGLGDIRIDVASRYEAMAPIDL
jgi:phosphoribosyl 1,2-cyclic phosphodiesterase